MNKILALVITPIIVIFFSFILGQYVYELPEELTTIFTVIFSFFGIFNFILPTTTIGTILNYTIQLQFIAWSFKGGLFLYRFITKSFHN